VKRGPLAFGAVTLTVVAIMTMFAVGTDSRRASTPGAEPPSASATSTPGGTAAASPVWRLDVPRSGGPFTARLSPDARMVAIESTSSRFGVVMYEIQPPAPLSDVAHLREVVRLDRVANPGQWLPDSSGLLVYEPDGPSSLTGTLSLVSTSGKRWSIATTQVDVFAARFSPDGRFAAFRVNSPGTFVVALDGSATYPIERDDTQYFAGWEPEGNLLFHLTTADVLEARAPDGRVIYSVPLPIDLRHLRANVPVAPQPRDMHVLSFGSSERHGPHIHTARVLFDRKIHDIPAGLEDLSTMMGDGPWRGRELVMRREADGELMAFDPRAGTTRAIGVTLPHDQTRWGMSGDYLAWGRHIVQLSTGRDHEWSAQPPPETIIALDSGRFVLWRDGTTELLDAAAWMAAPQSWSGELPRTSDQTGMASGWVRVRDDDGGFTVARPGSWSSYEGRARGAVLASDGLLPSAMPGAGEVRIEIRLDILGPRGPGDFLDGLAHHGGKVIERRTIQLSAGTTEFAIIYDNTQYPRPTTSLNWALKSPFLPDRVVWIRAWPLDSGRRAEVEAVVATLEFVAPR
jgi:hypothetical protein